MLMLNWICISVLASTFFIKEVMRMENSNWFEEASRRIKDVLLLLGEKQAKKYKIDMLLRMVHHMDRFSKNGCKECENLKENLNDLILLLENQNEMDPKQYKATFKLVVKHFVKKHGLVEEGTYLSLGMAYGLIFGAALSSFYYMAIPLGMLFGLVIGLWMDDKMKKQGRVV